VFDLDGEIWEVKRVDGDVVLYGVFGEDDGEDDWEVGETEDISKLIGMRVRAVLKGRMRWSIALIRMSGLFGMSGQKVM
jgi:hypothetical protein